MDNQLPPEESEEAPPKRTFDPNEIRAVMPERPERSRMLRFLLLGMLACGMYGAYYGYNRYQLNDKQWAFSQAYQKLHMALLARTDKGLIDEELVGVVVREFAKQADVHLVKDTLKIRIEPLGLENEHLLPNPAQGLMAIADQIPGSDKERWLVGFTGTFYAERGPASMTFEMTRYTYFYANAIAQAQEGKSNVEHYTPIRDEEIE